MNKIRKCKICKKEFIPRNISGLHKQLCCTPNCRDKYYYKQHTEKIKNIQIKSKVKHGSKWLNTRRKTRLNTVLEGNSVHCKNVIKRDYPIDNLCELCHKRSPKAYHHWRDKDIELSQNERKIISGLWICDHCHVVVDCFENSDKQKLYKLYLLLQKKIDKELGY